MCVHSHVKKASNPLWISPLANDEEMFYHSAPKLVACCPAHSMILFLQRSYGNTSVSDPRYVRQSRQFTVVSCPNYSRITIISGDYIGNEFSGNDMFQTWDRISNSSHPRVWVLTSWTSRGVIRLYRILHMFLLTQTWM